MSTLLPPCPLCDARMMPSPDSSRLWCQFCGATRDDPEALAALEAYQANPPQPAQYKLAARHFDINPQDQLALDQAWASIQQGDPRSASLLLHALVNRQPDLADGWYLLSLVAATPERRMTYLNRALDAQPYHEYAWRDKGVIEGVIPPGEGIAAHTPDPVGPVEAESETQECPSCGGALAFDIGAGALVCGHCGYQPGTALASSYQGGYDRLDNALLQRRFGFSREWHIGQRVLVCQNCHAQLTINSTTLSTQCPFCDSAHILVQDVVGSFEEPDALLPFKVDRGAAAKAVHHRLSSDLRVQVQRGDLTGVYLPFWAFEGIVSITVTGEFLSAEPFRPGVFSISNTLVAGVTRPPQAVLAELMPYDLDALVRYDSRYLARWSAQIYRTDVVQASLVARAYIQHAARRQATGYRVPAIELARPDRTDYNPPNTPLWQNARVALEAINYRLLLLPVWMVTLVLADGVHRPAVVNGQTGEAIISASFVRAEHITAGPPRRAEPERTIQPLPHRRVIRPLPPRQV